MRSKTLIVSLSLVLCAIFSSDVCALDGERKGFILGFGIGPGLTSYTQTWSDIAEQTVLYETGGRKNEFGLGTDFRIGYAPTNQLMVYYTNKVIWMLSFNYESGSEVNMISGVGLLGLSYYLAPASPSLYFTGTIGVSSWGSLDNIGNVWTGFGLGAGIGYEAAKYLSMELSLMWGNPGKTSRDFEASTNALGAMVTITGTWY